MRAYDLSGTIYMAPADSVGALTGAIRRTGNLYPLKIQVATKDKKQISKEHDKDGQTVASTTSIEAITAECVLRQLTARSFAWAVAGLATPMENEEVSVTDRAITTTEPGDYLQLGNRRVFDVVIKNTAGDVTYVKDVDYTLNAGLGIFTPIKGGKIVKDEAVKATFKAAAGAGYSVAIGKQPLIQVAMWGTLVNAYDGQEMELELYLVTITSPDGINLIAELDSEYEELALNLSLNTPPGRTCPGTINGVAI